MFCNIQPYVKRQLLITACLNIGYILVGYEIYWTGPIIPKLLNIEETPLTRVISATEASWVASLLLIGADVGAIIAGYAANLIGRRPCLILSGVLMIISHLIVNFPTSLGIIYAGRICIGASITMFLLVTLVYLGEISSPNIRGMLMTSASIFHSFGGFVVYCVGPYISYTQVGYVFFGISAVYITTSCFLPESPVYHVIKGNEEAAKESLRKLGRQDIDTELKKMMEQAVKTKTNSYLLRELFTDKGNRRALCVTIPLYIFQQSSGNMAVIFFATTIFNSAGSSIQPHIATMIVGATSLFSAIFSPMFIDKHGRRILLIISTAGCFASMTVLGAYFYLDHIGNSIVLWLGWLPLLCLVSALFFYGIGLSIIPNTLTGEMFSPSVRGLGSSITICIGLTTGLISTIIFGYVVDSIGTYAPFWIYAAANAIALAFIIFVVPETKGKTLLEIGNIMEEKL
ncbi:LOW QUALITY PROTEIN: facilitated trehalose transporter Tret1-like [Manduca sexta]|uniref:LOW QUALITY PROTEIN: facilitated trehalose transporter Tret1-like n=1 Tax=Manduca sexta TaxID=7130 RepID=UPI00188F26C0|nr:LOW QUALITY PROTEIN: facilitated trehalose transporter Tret1-like [Manduca sexta]